MCYLGTFGLREHRLVSDGFIHVSDGWRDINYNIQKGTFNFLTVNVILAWFYEWTPETCLFNSVPWSHLVKVCGIRGISSHGVR